MNAGRAVIRNALSGLLDYALVSGEAVRASKRSGHLRLGLFDRFLEYVDAYVQLLFGNDNWRRDSEHVSEHACGYHHQALSPRQALYLWDI